MAMVLWIFPASLFAEEPPFKLLATVVGNNSSYATCGIMHRESGEESVHRIGEELKGYQIVMITRGSITLLKEGRYYFLNLLPGNENQPAAASEDEPGLIKIKRALLDGAVGNLNSVLGQAPLVPYVESGKVAGLIIPPLNSKLMALLLNTTGLREGDVATAVNGETVDSIKKALELYNKFKGQEKIQLEIRRGDSIRNLTYSLN